MENKVRCHECGWEGSRHGCLSENAIVDGRCYMDDDDMNLDEVTVLLCPHCHCLVREIE
jgi:hypothetical protein